MDLSRKTAEAAGLLAQAKQITAFTGAGISAASGIPTYRGAGGLWTKYDPDKYANIQYFHKDPAYYWSFFRDVRDKALRAAVPNAAHEALARAEAQGKIAALITQNIDGLHHEAGSRRVLELHGNTRRFLCLGCDRRFTLDEVRALLEERLPPPCPACGGSIRPDVVFFGEGLDPRVLEQALAAARQADLMLVVGSSLVVHPAASLPLMCVEHGGTLVILNKGATPLDRLASVTIDGNAAEILPRLL